MVTALDAQTRDREECIVDRDCEEINRQLSQQLQGCLTKHHLFGLTKEDKVHIFALGVATGVLCTLSAILLCICLCFYGSTPETFPT